MKKIKAEIREKISNNEKVYLKHNVHVAYQSTVRGISRREAEEKLGKEIDFIYKGIVFSIPREDFPEKILEYEPHIETIIREFDDCIPMSGGMIERYEIFDIETGDVHVMYRVPYIEKPAQTSDIPE